MAVTCFWLEETSRVQVGLRRYRPSAKDGGQKCPRPGGWGYHGALTILGDAPLLYSLRRPAGGWVRARTGDRYGVPGFTYPPRDDPRWPRRCECGEPFTSDDPWQEWADPLYRRADTGELATLRDAPDGAMWDAWWYPWKGPDGRSLVAKCPGGHDWAIDGRASNCTLPDDSEHRCWVRHGDPPEITVDKAGLTCAAGAGSIQAGNYHGFLRDGAFT